MLIAILTNTAQVASASPIGGGKIAFVSNRDGNPEIYAMNADGSYQVRLTHDGASDATPAFSPDGTKIAFTSQRDGNSEIYVMDAHGSNQTNLTNNPANDSIPAFSPDGTKITFTSSRDGNNDIYVMDADGSNQTNLTLDGANNQASTFSPDGTKIAFSSASTWPYDTFHINVMDADGSNQTDLTPSAVEAFASAFSPDGTKIAFTEGLNGSSEIFEVDADGSNKVNLTKTNNEDEYDPTFSPDGTEIAFTCATGAVCVMPSDGSSRVRITSPSAGRDPSWGDVATSRSGLSLAVAKTRLQVKAIGLLEPASAGDKVTIGLARLSHHRWKLIANKTVFVKKFGDRDHDGLIDARYLAAFARPTTGRYRFTATFAGDWDTFRSTKSVTFKL